MTADAATRGLVVWPTFNYTATSWRDNQGLTIFATADDIIENGNNVDMAGLYSEAAIFDGSTLNYARGGYFTIDQDSTTGTTNYAHVVSTELDVAVSTTIDEGAGLHLNLVNSGTINNYRAIEIVDVIEGTQTNAYGIFANEGDWRLDL